MSARYIKFSLAILAPLAMVGLGCDSQRSTVPNVPDAGLDADSNTALSYVRPNACAASADLISDFEEGSGVIVPQAGMLGWWYVFSDSLPGTMTPPPSATGPISVEPVSGADQATCNKYALHSTQSGHVQWAGFGATFVPEGTGKRPVDISAHSGIRFKIKNNGGPTPVWFEILSKENQPPEYGGTAKNKSADLYNTRGRLLTNIGSTWTTISIPFATAAPRYLPAGCASGELCEAPILVPKDALGIQFAVYPQFGNATSYDLWVDDVYFFSGNDAYGTYPQASAATHYFPHDTDRVGSCAKPAKASGYHLIEMYNQWKATFVTADGATGGLRVKRPENNHDSVSAGIAYGMLIAVYMNDQGLFDGLWKYWQNHTIPNAPLMQWQIDAKGNALDVNSATDADEDAAFALMMAAKQWGGAYQDSAVQLVQAVFKYDVDSATYALRPGSGSQGSTLTNPSYFAPAYYRAFKRIDPTNAWESVTTSTYDMLSAIAGPKGLAPAWCSNNCTVAGGGGYQDSAKYQWDAHRIPWRIALDYCWNAEPQARAYLDKITTFFVGESKTAGIGNIVDVYDSTGAKAPNGKMNAMSILGSATVGAMAATPSADNTSFMNRGYQFLLDAAYTPDPPARAPLTAIYTYYNATMGLLTALTLTGNFTDFSTPPIE